MNSIIVFDFDGTLYDISCVRGMIHGLEEDFLCSYAGMSRDEAKSFMLAENIITPEQTKARSATECFLRMGIAPEVWARYRNERFDISCIAPDKAVTSGIIDGFRKFGELILLSSNTLEILHKIMKRINISPSLFSRIICSSSTQGRRFSKYDFFRELITSRNIAPHEVLSIGDRYMTDIYPLIQLGGRGILVKGVYSLKCILDDMNSGDLRKDSDSYDYYTSLA